MNDQTNPTTLPTPASAAGLRFDQAAAEMFPDYSRSRLTQWIKAGDLLLDGAQVAPRQLVHGGEI
ncbi:MAG: RNA pseudouridine synthase, partial [Rudaea sp.]|nr:RNA pseudouridine synthase [Rudaea sp.]